MKKKYLKFLNYLKYFILTLSFGFIGVYLFIVFLPFPRAIDVGLDLSCLYGISRAAADKLVFGKDIIFTYGPLGYLVSGVALEQNFWSVVVFRILVHLMLFLVSIAKLIKLKKKLQRIYLFISLLFIHLVVGVYTDYQIVLIVIIILSWDEILNRKFIRFWSLGIGAIAGFCLLTKFTAGVLTFGSLFLLLLTNIYASIKSKLDVRNSILALVDSLLSATSVSFLFLNPNPLVSLQKLLSCITTAGILAVIIWLFNRKPSHEVLLQDRENSLVKTFRRILSSPNSLEGHIFYCSYCLLLFITVFSSYPSIINYIKNCLEISSGYSSGMSIVGSSWNLSFAILEIILILILLILVAYERALGFSLSCAFILWVFFKHGFVRHDGLFFLPFTPLIASLCITKIKRNSALKYAYSLQILLLGIVVVCYFFSPGFANNIYAVNIFDKIGYVKFFNHASGLFDLKAVQKINITNQQAVNLAPIKLPDNVQNLLKNKKIDIVPLEISLVEANQLHWKPRPIFQSYAAYTSRLDRINSESLQKDQRDYLLYQFLSIDGRHPFFDEPETLFNIFCNYKISSDVNNFVSMPALPNLMILEKRQSGICSSETEAKKLSIGWNQPTKISEGFMVRAAIKFEYSIWGKVCKALFRIPPVLMNVNFMNGFKYSYRILPENSENGILVSHLPINELEALSFFKGNLPIPVSSFSFSTTNRILYKPTIDITFYSYNSLDTSLKQEIDTLQLKKASFSANQTEDYMGWINPNQEIVKRGDTINLGGWAVSRISPGKPVWVLLTYGSNNKLIAFTKTGLPRPDVAQVFNNNDYYYSGWSASLNSENIEENVYVVKAWYYDPSSNIAQPLQGEHRVEIR